MPLTAQQRQAQIRKDRQKVLVVLPLALGGLLYWGHRLQAQSREATLIAQALPPLTLAQMQGVRTTYEARVAQFYEQQRLIAAQKAQRKQFVLEEAKYVKDHPQQPLPDAQCTALEDPITLEEFQITDPNLVMIIFSRGPPAQGQCYFRSALIEWFNTRGEEGEYISNEATVKVQGGRFNDLYVQAFKLPDGTYISTQSRNVLEKSRSRKFWRFELADIRFKEENTKLYGLVPIPGDERRRFLGLL